MTNKVCRFCFCCCGQLFYGNKKSIKKVCFLVFKSFWIKGLEIKHVLKWFRVSRVFKYKAAIYHVLAVLSARTIKICAVFLAVKTETSASLKGAAWQPAGRCEPQTHVLSEGVYIFCKSEGLRIILCSLNYLITPKILFPSCFGLFKNI